MRKKNRHLLSKIFEYFNFLVSRNRNVTCDFHGFVEGSSWFETTVIFYRNTRSRSATIRLNLVLQHSWQNTTCPTALLTVWECVRDDLSQTKKEKGVTHLKSN